MEKANNHIKVRICYLKPDIQFVRDVAVLVGSTIESALVQSEVLAQLPEIDMATVCVGIYGKKKSLSDVVREGDRIEIYRPLIVDPKEARRRRVAKKIGTK